MMKLNKNTNVKLELVPIEYEDALMTKPCGIMIGGMCVGVHQHIVIFSKGPNEE